MFGPKAKKSELGSGPAQVYLLSKIRHIGTFKLTAAVSAKSVRVQSDYAETSALDEQAQSRERVIRNSNGRLRP